MNDDPFETRLKALRRQDLAADWKAGILAAADAQTPPRRATLAPPRWLAWSLAAGWALVLVLHLLTPPARMDEDRLVVQPPDSGHALQQRQELFASLVSTHLPVSP